MKVLYIRLENYIGVYNGRGDNVLELDLSNSTDNIFVIRGKNGSGKSTLLRAISPINDTNADLIPGLEGRKVIRYLFNNEIYEIEYVHPVKADGSRGQAKGQVFKGKQREELNPTWNISTTRDIVYSLFNLDSNFLSLSQLSSEDRGLADKTPYERKHFVNSIINDIDVYNEMYKTITKKHSLYKNMIDSLVGKINKIGNKEDLDGQFSNISRQVEEVSALRDKSLVKSVNIQTKIDMIEENNKMNVYHDAKKSLDEKSKELYTINIKISKSLNNSIQFENIDDINNTVSNMHIAAQDTLSEISNRLVKSNSELTQKSKSRDDTYSELQSKITKRNAIIDTDISAESLDRYNKAKEDLAILEDNISKFNIQLKTPDEIVAVIDNVYNTINTMKDTILDGYQYIDKDTAVQYMEKIFNNVVVPDPKEMNNSLSIVNNDLEELSHQYDHFIALNSESETLEEKLKVCNCPNCPYVKDAIEASKHDPAKKIKELDKKLKELTEQKEYLESTIRITEECIDFGYRFNSYMNTINSLKSLISKTPLKILLDKQYLLETIIRPRYINDIHEMVNNLRAYYNSITSKQAIADTIDSLKEPAMKYEANKLLIDSLDEDIASLQERFNELDSCVKVLHEEINKDEEMLDLQNVIIANIEDTLGLIANGLDVQSKIYELNNTIESYDNILKNLESLNTELTDYKNLTNQYNSTLNELLAKRDVIAYNKTLLDDYTAEYAQYREKYAKLETVKYYVSPSTGIQTVFMGAYMNNIILKANELLSLIFSGQYIIQPFIINESEFRIPCLGSGLINDDISSMSTSQICMISMILSFAILSNSSTDYNILKLDEIDGGLDTDNRAQFISLLNQLIGLVGCEQCFVISHNMEYGDDCTIIDMSKRPIINITSK